MTLYHICITTMHNFYEFAHHFCQWFQDMYMCISSSSICTLYNYIIITSHIIPHLQGRYVEALQDVSAAIHLDPNGAPAFYHRACLLQTSQPEQALKDLSVSLLLDDSVANVSAYVHRGVLYTQMKWSANFFSVLQYIV